MKGHSLDSYNGYSSSQTQLPSYTSHLSPPSSRYPGRSFRRDGAGEIDGDGDCDGDGDGEGNGDGDGFGNRDIEDNEDGDFLRPNQSRPERSPVSTVSWSKQTNVVRKRAESRKKPRSPRDGSIGLSRFSFLKNKLNCFAGSVIGLSFANAMVASLRERRSLVYFIFF